MQFPSALSLSIDIENVSRLNKHELSLYSSAMQLALLLLLLLHCPQQPTHGVDCLELARTPTSQPTAGRFSIYTDRAEQSKDETR